MAKQKVLEVTLRIPMPHDDGHAIVESTLEPRIREAAKAFQKTLVENGLWAVRNRPIEYTAEYVYQRVRITGTIERLRRVVRPSA